MSNGITTEKIDEKIAELKQGLPGAIRNKSYSEVGRIVCKLDDLESLRQLVAGGHE
jgi:hypothetical protein